MRILSLLTAVLAISAAQAADLPLADTACTNYICFDATPNVSYVGTDSTYSSAIVMLDDDNVARSTSLDRRCAKVAWRMLAGLCSTQPHGDDPPRNARAWPHGPHALHRAAEAKQIKGIRDAARIQPRESRD